MICDERQRFSSDVEPGCGSLSVMNIISSAYRMVNVVGHILYVLNGWIGATD